MKRLVFALASIFAVLLPTYCSAQIFDLASSAAPTPIQMMPGTPPNLILINRVSGQEYKILTAVAARTIPPFALSGLPLPAGFKVDEMFLSGFTKCDEKPLNAWIATLKKADDEAAVAAAVSATSVADLRNSYSETCWNALAQDKVAQSIAATRMEVNLAAYMLKESQQLVVTVTRVSGSSVKTWTFTLQTPEAGHWLTTWGFGFTSDRSDHFFQKQLADGTFQITKERDLDKSDLTFVPAVFFHWMPGKDEQAGWSFSPFTAGIGLSKDAPAVMLGASVTRRQNLTLIGGFAFSHSQRLGGIYVPDQILKEKTADDKLYEVTYRPSLFFSLGIRFDKNPFAGADEKKAAGAADPAKGDTDADSSKKATDKAAAKTKPSGA